MHNTSVRAPFLLLLLILSVAVGAWAADETEVITVAVVPLRNVSTPDTTVDWMGWGFAEALCTKLSNVTTIQVVERSRLSDAMKEIKLQNSALVDAATAAKLGKILGARSVIVGSLQKSEGNLRADARVVNVETSVASSGVEVVGKVGDVFKLESDLALKLVTALGKKAGGEVAEMIAQAETSSAGAYEWFSRGLTCSDRKDYESAISAYTEAINLDPNYYLAYNKRAEAYYTPDRDGPSGFKNTERVIEDYTKSIALNRNCIDSYRGRGLAFLRLWSGGTDEGKDKAIADFSKAISMNPNSIDSYLDRSLAYRLKKERGRAVEDCNRALALDPNNADVYIARGKIYADEDVDRAIEDYTKAIAVNPGYARGYLTRGGAYETKKDYDKAIEDYTKAIDVSPSSRVGYIHRGSAYVTKGEFDLAIVDYTKAVELDPDDPWAYRSRSDVYKSKKDYEKAVADFSRFITLVAKPNEYHYQMRAEMYREMKAYDKSLSDYDKALNICDANYRDQWIVQRGWARLLAGDKQGAKWDAESVLDMERSIYKDSARSLLKLCK